MNESEQAQAIAEIKDALLHEVVPGENEAWYSVLKFAAHVGALKAETYPDAQTIAEAGATVLEAEP